MTDRVYLKNDVTGGVTDVPNDEVVLADYASRGWHPEPRPPIMPHIPSPDGIGDRKLNPADYVSPEPEPESAQATSKSKR